MSETKLRRSVTLLDGTKADLERIKNETGATTDNAAINEAVSFRAEFLGDDANSIRDAVSLRDLLRDKLSGRKIEEVFLALSVYEQIRPDIDSGNSLFLVDRTNPNMRTKVLVPSIG